MILKAACAAVSMSSVILIQSSPQGSLSRVIGQFKQNDVVVSVPVADDLTLERAALRVFVASGVQAGIERLLDLPHKPGPRKPVPTKPVRLTGHTASEAIELLGRGRGPVRTSSSSSIVHVSFGISEGRTILDMNVRQFQVEDATLPNVLDKIHQLVEPNVANEPPFVGRFDVGLGLIPSPGRESRPPSPRDMKRSSVRIDGPVSVRGVLDEIAERFQCSWVVRYHDPAKSLAGYEIGFATPDGEVITLRAR